MISLLILSYCLLGAFGSPAPYLDDRIVGGVEANIEDIPYQISLRSYSIPICGGTILNERNIVTASHCVDGKNPQRMTVRVGSTYKESGGKIIQVSKLIMHEKYSRLTKDYDVAIVKLAESLVFGDGVQPIPLQDAGADIPAGTIALISGWGRRASNDSDSPDHLMKTNVEVIDLETCRAKYKQNPVTDRMFCCTSDGHDSCQGDSGGPLVIDGKLTGIVSWGKGCGSGRYPGVYTKVSLVRSWIEEKGSESY